MVNLSNQWYQWWAEDPGGGQAGTRFNVRKVPFHQAYCNPRKFWGLLSIVNGVNWQNSAPLQEIEYALIFSFSPLHI